MINVGIPGTTTARGIGRIATSADLVDGATINNGPAFLAAGVHTSVAPAAGKVPVADSNGKLDSWVSQQTQFATCATAAATAEKEATLTGFSLIKGARVFVIFTNANTVAGALTLNVNGTGAKPIYLGNSAASATSPFFIPAGVALEFVYNGTAWVHTSCIIESWEDSGRGLWYKKWSDGLIEQGIAGNGGATITFPTPFLRSDKSRFYKVGLISSNTAAYSPTFVVHSDSLTGAVVSARVDGVTNTGLYWTLEVSGY